MSEFDTTLNGIVYPDFRITFKYNGTVDDGNVGKAATQDTTVANTVKLAGDGDEIIGRFFAQEDRAQQGGGKFATVSTKGGFTLPYKTGETIAVGDEVIGAGAGEVRKVDEGEKGIRVWAVDTTAKKVTVLM